MASHPRCGRKSPGAGRLSILLETLSRCISFSLATWCGASGRRIGRGTRAWLRAVALRQASSMTMAMWSSWSTPLRAAGSVRGLLRHHRRVRPRRQCRRLPLLLHQRRHRRRLKRQNRSRCQRQQRRKCLRLLHCPLLPVRRSSPLPLWRRRPLPLRCHCPLSLRCQCPLSPRCQCPLSLRRRRSLPRQHVMRSRSSFASAAVPATRRSSATTTSPHSFRALARGQRCVQLPSKR